MTEMRSVPFVEDRIVIDASNAYSQPPTSQENEVDLYGPNACSQPPTSQANEVDVIATDKIIQEDGDGGDDDVDLDEVEEGFHGIDVGMASSGSMTRPPCSDQEDTPKTWKEAELDTIKKKDVPTPQCWCGDVYKSPPPLCKYFTWIDQEVPEHVQEDQYREAMWREHLLNEALAREEERERREKEKKECKKREDEKKCKEKEARKEERARNFARARDAQAKDEARDKKGKWPSTTQ
ncbi:hypothetical protein ZWY2020_057592 [Hordeum vulgare]|nr:hypothetical protein ZWY2020_057592 [Hordeum vulgare]